MARRTRKNKRKNRNKTRRTGGAGTRPKTLGQGATLEDVIAQLNNVITFCCGGGGGGAGGGGAGGGGGGGSGSEGGGGDPKPTNGVGKRKQAGRKRPMNAYMLALDKARKSGADSFEYKGKTYHKSATKTGMIIYSKKKK